MILAAEAFIAELDRVRVSFGDILQVDGTLVRNPAFVEFAFAAARGSYWDRCVQSNFLKNAGFLEKHGWRFFYTFFGGD
jgi:hypothetical protein